MEIKQLREHGRPLMPHYQVWKNFWSLQGMSLSGYSHQGLGPERALSPDGWCNDQDGCSPRHPSTVSPQIPYPQSILQKTANAAAPGGQDCDTNYVCSLCLWNTSEAPFQSHLTSFLIATWFWLYLPILNRGWLVRDFEMFVGSELEASLLFAQVRWFCLPQASKYHLLGSGGRAGTP